jgi:hypothetical protein
MLELVLEGNELTMDLRHATGEIVEMLRRTHTGHDILTLRVDTGITEERPLAVRRVAREADAGARRGPEVAEHHGHDRDRSAPLVGHPVDAPVVHGLLRPPRVEDGIDREAQLIPRAPGERLTGSVQTRPYFPRRP